MSFRSRRYCFLSISVLLFATLSFLSCANERGAIPGVNTLGATLKGKRVLVAYKTQDGMSLTTAPDLVCAFLRQRIQITCVNLFSEDAEVLERNGITIDQFLKAQTDIFMSGKTSTTYKKGILLLDTDYSLDFGAMYLDHVGYVLWEVSIAAVVRDTHDPRRVLGEVVKGSSEWGMGNKENELKAIRKAARNFAEDLEHLRLTER